MKYLLLMFGSMMVMSGVACANGGSVGGLNSDDLKKLEKQPTISAPESKNSNAEQDKKQ